MKPTRSVPSGRIVKEGSLLPAVLLGLTAAICPVPVFSQNPSAVNAAPGSISLEWCQNASRENSPYLAKMSFIDQGARLSIGAANTAWLPKVTLSGKYTDQSDAASLDLGINLPGLSLPSPDTVQWQVGAEASQTIWDGGMTSAIKKGLRAGANADRLKAEIGLYGLRSQINALYFGILVIDGQLEQNAVLRNELAANRKRVAAWAANGVATASDLNAVDVELLNAEQARYSLEAARKNVIESLSIMTGSSFTGSETFETPPAPAGEAMENRESARHTAGIARPEATWFSALAAANDSRKAQFTAQAMPRLSAFVQAGYGVPSLNMFNPDPGAFWIAGIRAAWAIDGFWSLPFNLAKVEADTRSIGTDREAFFRSVDSEIATKMSEIERLTGLVQTDDEIAALRKRMKDAAKNRLENGTIGTVDYLQALAAETLALQSRSLHEVQLLEARYALANTVNK